MTEPFTAPFPVPPYPPAHWFTERPPGLDAETKITVDDQGRVYGYFYNRDQCLVHDHGACPAPSPTGYSAFHQNEVIVDGGAALRVGVIGNVNGHASPYAKVDAASAHYADPDRQLIVCKAYDDEHGGYILGAMVPHATYGDVALVRRSALSGDWRPMPESWWSAHGVGRAAVAAAEGYDCIGPTLVTRPGLPLVRRFVAAGRAGAMLGGVGGVDYEVPERTERVMARVELPGGVTIVTEGEVTPNYGEPGPHPAPAIPVEPAVVASVEAPAEPTLAEVLAEVRSLASRVDGIDHVVGRLASAAVNAADPGEPEFPAEDDDPKA